MKILVVGAGTAGLISALILKKYLDFQVDIVYSEKDEIIGVGEGSTEHFNEFMNFLQINQYEIINECGATYKSGIMFDSWNINKNYLHNVGDPFSNKYGQYSFIYGRQIGLNLPITPKLLWKNKINKWFLNRPEIPPFNQYHFDTYKLNLFLKKKCKELGISLYEDKINNVKFYQNGYIENVVGDNKTYSYDFYIDSSGFKKILIGKMGARWISASKYLKMKNVITFRTDEENDYNLWTLSKAMKYGWRFKIPVQGRNGNGYVYDGDYIDRDQAKLEIEDELGYEISIGKEFNFDPGYLENPWINNCVAVGLSGSFFEPLEASSIGSSIQQSFLLMHKISNYDENIIKNYNKSFISIMENIRDFISLHYITNRRDTDFWVDIQKTEIPESLYEKIMMWKNKLPIREDFNNSSDYLMFIEGHFTCVMEGLELFDRQKIKQEFNFLPKNIKIEADRLVLELNNFEDSIQTFSHKEFINKILEILK